MTTHVFTADGAKITAYLDGPKWNNEPTATLGAFTCKTADAGRNVLDQAIAHIRAAGIRQIIGPMDGDTWHSYRFVTQSDSSPAFLMEPQETPGALSLFQQAGFTPISAYFSARVPVAQAGGVAPKDTTDFTITTWDGSDPEALFGQVHDLSTQAFSGNAFYKPISRADFLAMYLPMVPLLKPELIFFARRPDGSLAGFLFGIPNYAEGPKPDTVILKTYASIARGAGRHLAYAFHKAAADAGYSTAIHALIHDDNQSADRSAAEGAEVFRRYTLFGRVLDG